MNGNATFKLYGIKNCDTMKHAMRWLSEHGIAYEFIDYKKAGIAADRLPHWMAAVGVDVLLNRRGLMWKKLTEAERSDIDADKALALMSATPTLIKRPVLEWGQNVMVGFSPENYSKLLTKR